MAEHLRESHNGIERGTYLMAHIGKESRFQFVSLFCFLLSLQERMFQSHLMIDALGQSTYLDYPVLRFVFCHHRIHLQVIPRVLFPRSPNSHTPVEPHILSLSHRISEIVANLTVIRMENIYKIGYSCGTVVNRHFIVLVPLSCGISCIVDDINPCISQLGKVGGERYNLVQFVDFLRVVLLAGLIYVCHKICFHFSVAAV